MLPLLSHPAGVISFEVCTNTVSNAPNLIQKSRLQLSDFLHTQHHCYVISANSENKYILVVNCNIKPCSIKLQ